MRKPGTLIFLNNNRLQTPQSYLRLAGFLAVDATAPAAWTTHSVIELGVSLLNAAFSRFYHFGILHPANPFVSCERSNVTPSCQCFRISGQRPTQVRR